MAHYVCQERYGTVISKQGNQTERVARFLKPWSKSLADAERISSRARLLFEEMSSREKGWPKKVNFQGWFCPQKNWEKWVEKLEVKHSTMWKQTGIYNAIMSSCCEIRRNKEIVLGLVEFWCVEMNTFVFPWGEATITLEDVMILGGFSVIGDPIKMAVNTGELKILVDAIKERKSVITKKGTKKAHHGAWMKHFMENENDSDVAHVAFLALWLSRYVFPSRTTDSVATDVFSIAAHLAVGTQMALAPAILAGLYKNLSLLKEKALSSFDDEITIFAPFQLVLLWGFEHFPSLVKTSPNVLLPGEPRAARWYQVVCKMDKSVVNSIFVSGQCFRWRPYAADIKNWNHSSYYSVEEHLEVDSEKNSDMDLQCYLVCMRMCYLVGFDSQEKYMPHRVAMQFGFDQDLPGEFSGFDFGLKDVYFFVPPKSLEPGVSSRYFKWWRNSEFMCAGKVSNVLKRSSDTFQMPPVEGEMSPKDYHTPSVATRLKNSKTVSPSSIKCEPIEILDNEQEFDKWSNNFDAKFKPVEGEVSPKDYHTPTVATRLKNSKTVSPSSIKCEPIEILDDEQEFDKWSNNFDAKFKPVCESGFPTREPGCLDRRSPSMDEVGGAGGCTVAKLFGSISPETSTPCSVGVRSVTSKFSSAQRFQDFVAANHVAAVAGASIQMAKDFEKMDDNLHSESDSRHIANGSSSRAAFDEARFNKSIKKRKLSTSTEESSDCKATISMINGNTDELQGESVGATMDVDERDFEILKLDLEKRIEKLEELMGITPDR